MDKVFYSDGANVPKAFSYCPRKHTKECLRIDRKSFTDVLNTMQTMTIHTSENESAALGGTEWLHLLSDISPTEPEHFSDSNAYIQHLQRTFQMRVTVKDFSKEQENLDALGRSMSGNDLVIAPNILEEMVTNREKAQYYEEKIRYWFDNIPKWKAESAAMGLTYEPCGVAIHEDGTVYYIGGGTEMPERKAQIEEAQKAKREKKFKRRQEQQAYIQALIQQKQADALAAHWASLAVPAPVFVTTKKILPDGSIYITTKKDGKIVERTTKKPHLIPVLDATAEGGVKMEPAQNLFDLL